MLYKLRTNLFPLWLSLFSPLSSPGRTRQLENFRQFSNHSTEWPDRRLEEGPRTWPWWCPRPQSPPPAPGPLCCSLSQRRFAHPQSGSMKQERDRRGGDFINQVTWRPRNCFSLLQSLKAVTKTTIITATSIANPSIQSVLWSSTSSERLKNVNKIFATFFF